MLRERIIRAWKDPEYRLNLSEEEQAQLPENPAGAIELTDDELDMATGGHSTVPPWKHQSYSNSRSQSQSYSRSRSRSYSQSYSQSQSNSNSNSQSYSYSSQSWRRPNSHSYSSSSRSYSRRY